MQLHYMFNTNFWLEHECSCLFLMDLVMIFGVQKPSGIIALLDEAWYASQHVDHYNHCRITSEIGSQVLQ